MTAVLDSRLRGNDNAFGNLPAPLSAPLPAPVCPCLPTGRGRQGVQDDSQGLLRASQ